MQLTNNETKELIFSTTNDSAKAGEAVLFSVNTNLSTKQRQFYIKELIRRWNEYDSLKAKADVCDELAKALEDFHAWSKHYPWFIKGLYEVLPKDMVVGKTYNYDKILKIIAELD